MFVRIASPAIAAHSTEKIARDLVQAAHVAGNLFIENLGISDGAAFGHLKSFRPIDAHVQSRFVSAGASRLGALDVAFFDTAGEAVAAGVPLA